MKEILLTKEQFDKSSNYKELDNKLNLVKSLPYGKGIYEISKKEVDAIFLLGILIGETN